MNYVSHTHIHHSGTGTHQHTYITTTHDCVQYEPDNPATAS